MERRNFLKLVAIAAPTTGAIVKRFVESDDYYESLETSTPAYVPCEGIATFSCVKPIAVSGGFIIATMPNGEEVINQISFPYTYNLFPNDILEVNYDFHVESTGKKLAVPITKLQFELPDLANNSLEKTSDVPKIT